jgi:hypothetical protein
MKKNFRTVKTGIIFGILLLSLFTVFAPSASAAIFNADPLITVTYPEQDENVVPNTKALRIPLETTFELYGPLASFVRASPLLQDSVVPITLNIIGPNELGVDATLENNLFDIKLGVNTPWVSYLTVTVNEDIQFNTVGTVKIKAISDPVSGFLLGVKGGSREFDVGFVIGFWPVISPEIPKGNFQEIGPLDTADFTIDIENLGNAVTYVAIELLDVPEDEWSISMPSSVHLASAVGASGSGTSKTVHLKIKPPYGFGLHNERKSFRVRLTPSLLGDPNQAGQSEEIVFTVQSVGMSPGVGYEIPLIVSVLVIIGFIFYFFRRRK